MNAFNAIGRLWHRIMDEPPAQHTAIVFHWPARTAGELEDRTFVLRGVLRGEALDRVLDALLEEHVPATDGSQEVITEITLFWHLSDGGWDMEELVSHYYPTDACSADTP